MAWAQMQIGNKGWSGFSSGLAVGEVMAHQRDENNGRQTEMMFRVVADTGRYTHLVRIYKCLVNAEGIKECVKSCSRTSWKKSTSVICKHAAVVLLMHHKQEVSIQFDRDDRHMDNWRRQIFLKEERGDDDEHSDDQRDDSSFQIGDGSAGMVVLHPAETRSIRSIADKGRAAVDTYEQRKEVRFSHSQEQYQESCCFPSTTASGSSGPGLLETLKLKMSGVKGVSVMVARRAPDQENASEVVASSSRASRTAASGNKEASSSYVKTGANVFPLEGRQSPPGERECSPTVDLDDVYYNRARTRRPKCAGTIDLGVLVGIYGAVDTHTCAVDLIDAAADGDDLFFWGYTFDRNDVSLALIDARERRHITVKVLLDKRITFEKTTKDMYEQIAKMSSFGVQVRLASGLDLHKEYNAVGRPVSSAKGDFVGASHSKAILTGQWLLCGSTNWTTSSRGNVEMSTLSRLSEFASREQYRIANVQWDKAVEFTEDLRHQEEHRGRADSRSRSASAFRR
jgi:hypothetical protein